MPEPISSSDHHHRGAGVRPWPQGALTGKTTAEFTARHGLTFPLGNSADARAIARLTGAFVNSGMTKSAPPPWRA
ncbi:MAG: hypothetical protein WAK44_04330, partial [Trebonia sp.]